MNLTKRKSLAPALLMAVLALSFLLAVFLTTPPSQAQKIKELVKKMAESKEYKKLV